MNEKNGKIRQSTFPVGAQSCQRMWKTKVSRFLLFTPLLKALWGGHTAALQFLIGHRPLMCEEEHAIDDRRLLAAIIMKYSFSEGKVICFATRRGTFFTNRDKSKSETWTFYPQCMRYTSYVKKGFPRRNHKIKSENIEI